MKRCAPGSIDSIDLDVAEKAVRASTAVHKIKVMKLRIEKGSAMWLKSSWGWLSLLLALFTVLGVTRMEIRPAVPDDDIVSLASFFTYDFAVVAALGSFVRREKRRYPATLALLALVVGSLFMPGSVAWLLLFPTMSIMLFVSWWGLVAIASFVLLLWALRAISCKSVPSTDHR